MGCPIVHICLYSSYVICGTGLVHVELVFKAYMINVKVILITHNHLINVKLVFIALVIHVDLVFPFSRFAMENP